MKNKLNKYIVIEIIKNYIFILSILTLLFWVTQAAKFLNLITEMGMENQEYIVFIIMLIPKTITQLMLISFSISLFFTITQLQQNKEIEIYLLSGVSKEHLIKLIIGTSIFITLIALFLFVYLAPLTNLKSRNIIAETNFTAINLLVKKNNFNSPVNNLTIYVHKNNNKGNLEKIYIFEKNKTIISQKGRVLNISDKNYLELLNGVIHEKNLNNEITSIKFEKTLYNFTKFQTKLITTPKFQERDFIWILQNYYKSKNPEILYEIHKRILKPFYIPIIAIICCFIFYSNNEKINLHKIKFITFSFTVILMIVLEIFLNMSTVNNLFKYIFYISSFSIPIILIFVLKKFLKTETRNS